MSFNQIKIFFKIYKFIILLLITKVSLYLIDKDGAEIKHSIKPINTQFENPLKGLKKSNLNELPTSVVELVLFSLFFL